LGPRFLSNAFNSREEDFCCLHKLGNDGQLKGIPLKGSSAISLIKSALLVEEKTTTNIPLLNNILLTTTTINNENDEIVEILPKNCLDKK
jgi:hypothetical protein